MTAATRSRTAYSASFFAAAYAHAASAYPDEACGLCLHDGSYHRADNIQNQLHRNDPARYPRDARTAYTMSPVDLQLLSGNHGHMPLAIVHSHPDVGAYFSQEDSRKAMYLGQPLFDVAYLVIDVRKGQCKGCLEFRFESESNGFQQTAAFDAAGCLMSN